MNVEPIPPTTAAVDDRPHRATYSPEDDKIRVYPAFRLPREDYDRLKSAGFGWAPKQECFFQVWTPEREDAALSLAPELEDEDTSLVDRQEARAERFETRSERRAEESKEAYAAADRIMGGIPLGQPILVGHRSERWARKDAARIDANLRKAVSFWRLSEYWERRAAGALRHAKYKELPAVRHRRIKGLEADARRQEKARAESEALSKRWQADGLTTERAKGLADLGHVSVQEDGKPYTSSLWSMLDGGRITVEAARELALAYHGRIIARAERWLEHITNRLAYERAMLAEAGGIRAAAFEIAVGGRVLARRWYVVRKVNRGASGEIASVSVVGERGGIPIESVTDYRAPEAGDADKVEAATKLPPLVNYDGQDRVRMTAAEWKREQACGSGSVVRREASGEHAAYRARTAFVPGGSFRTAVVFLTDAPVRERPAAQKAAPAATFETELPPPRRAPASRAPRGAPEHVTAARARLAGGGAKVVVNPELFPTPPELAARMAALADVAGQVVLEPSAGTGVLADAARAAGAAGVLCVEPHDACVRELEAKGHTVHRSTFEDFERRMALSTDPRGAPITRVIMNPPFGGKRDIEHVALAWRMLPAGGVLVAVMAAGIRFRQDKATAALRAEIERYGSIEDLPASTFAHARTGVSTVLVVMRCPS